MAQYIETRKPKKTREKAEANEETTPTPRGQASPIRTKRLL